ncbi:MAG: DNA repair protein RadC [Clostridiales bacterium]|jgi:DNA repair protein RadC|nr:DNA repair protein RadC [Clostridiales bacterium]
MGNELHKGHRQRVKKRYLASGLDSFEDHQALEFLLFYCYPLKDTNEPAHKMLKEFGSLSNLFDAGPAEISRRCNVTENVAILVSLIPSLAKRYSLAKWEKKAVLNTSAKAGRYAVSLFIGKKYECFYLVCLDTQRKLIYPQIISEGTIDETPVYPRIIVEESLKHKAACVFLAHNHPSGDPTPSQSDIIATKKITAALEPLDIEVLDHILVAGENYISFAEKKIL